MSEPFLGQIQPFGFNFAPAGWTKCDGQLLPISQNTALFSLLGTQYGGDGETTFAVPDLRGRVPLHEGSRPGVGSFTLGEVGGVHEVSLQVSQIPAHNHPAVCKDGPGNATEAQGNFWSKDAGFQSATYNTEGGGAMNAGAIGNTGGGNAHTNMQPYLVINWCIALTGIFPSGF